MKEQHLVTTNTLDSQPFDKMWHFDTIMSILPCLRKLFRI